MNWKTALALFAVVLVAVLTAHLIALKIVAVKAEAAMKDSGTASIFGWLAKK